MVLNLVKCLIACTVFYLFVISPVSALTNPGFETGDYGDWFHVGTTEIGTTYAYSGTYGAKVAAPGAPSAYIGQSITLDEWLSFERRLLDTSEADFTVSWQGSSPTGNAVLYTEAGTSGWSRIYVDTSDRIGYYGNIKFSGTSYTGDGFEVWLDDVSTSEAPYGDLTGYVHDNYGYPIGPAYLSIDLSGFTTESDDFGYYEINDIPNGDYLLTVTSGQNLDFTANISITNDLEYNVTLTRKSPEIISGPSVIESSQSSLRIGWTENSVTDSVKIYKGTSTNLIYTMDTSYTYINSYTDSSLNCGTPYDYWIQPFDDAVAGSKYEVSGITDNCDVLVVPPVYTATPTPTPTETPDDGVEDEEGLIEIIDEFVDNVIEDLTELFDETLIEPTKVIIEEVIIHVSTTFNWLLLGFVYLSTLVGRIFNKVEDLVEIIIDTALYGTVAMIVILLMSFVGLSFIFSSELISVIVFIIVGFGFGVIPEFLKSEDIPGRD